MLTTGATEEGVVVMTEIAAVVVPFAVVPFAVVPFAIVPFASTSAVMYWLVTARLLCDSCGLSMLDISCPCCA
jgi:hypothetical protein